MSVDVDALMDCLNAVNGVRAVHLNN